MGNRWLSTGEFAKEFAKRRRVSPPARGTVIEWIRKGYIPRRFVKKKRYGLKQFRYLIREEAIEHLLNEIG